MKMVCFDALTGNKKYEYNDSLSNSECEVCMKTAKSYDEEAFLCKKNRYFISKFSPDRKDLFYFCLTEARTKKHARSYVKVAIQSFRKSLEVTQNIVDIQKNASEISVHNTRNLNAEINNKLLSLINEVGLAEANDRIAYIENKIRNNPRAFAREVLSILKSSSQIMNEYSIHDLISHTSHLHMADFSYHKIHTLCVMSFYLNEQDFKEKNIYLSIAKSYQEVCINWATARTALAQLFDNCLKYCKPNSRIDVSFDKGVNGYIDATFHMTSLFFSNEEAPNLTLPGIRGSLVGAVDKKGRGIGMSIIQRMMDLNYGYLKYQSLDSTKYHSDGIPYSSNTFVLGFRCTMD